MSVDHERHRFEEQFTDVDRLEDRRKPNPYSSTLVKPHSLQRMPEYRIFLDANIIIGAGKPPAGPIIKSLSQLAKAGLVEIVTTDITISEVGRYFARKDFDVLKNVTKSRFRKLATNQFKIDFPEISTGELFDSLFKVSRAQTQRMFNDIGAKTLKVDDVKPTTVFEDYFLGRGVFGPEAKKEQFPDAFAFACVKAYADKVGLVMVVTSDGDFTAAIGGAPLLTLRKNIPELLGDIGELVDVDPKLLAFVTDPDRDLATWFSDELQGWGLNVINPEDAEIYELSVVEVELHNVQSFGPIMPAAAHLLIGSAKMRVLANYEHPDWDSAMYDSEDKRLIPFESVSGESEIEIVAPFAMSVLVDEDSDFIEIDSVEFTDDDFLWVDLTAQSYND